MERTIFLHSEQSTSIRNIALTLVNVLTYPGSLPRLTLMLVLLCVAFFSFSFSKEKLFFFNYTLKIINNKQISDAQSFFKALC